MISCDDCKYDQRPSWEEPCDRCENHEDWEPKKEDLYLTFRSLNDCGIIHSKIEEKLTSVEHNIGIEIDVLNAKSRRGIERDNQFQEVLLKVIGNLKNYYDMENGDYDNDKLTFDLSKLIYELDDSKIPICQKCGKQLTMDIATINTIDWYCEYCSNNELKEEMELWEGIGAEKNLIKRFVKDLNGSWTLAYLKGK